MCDATVARSVGVDRAAYSLAERAEEAVKRSNMPSKLR
jgi:hypothetical protein